MTIYRIVLVKYKPEATPAQRAAWVAGMKTLLGAVPQLKDFHGGKKIARDQDGGWDEGVIAAFANQEDLNAYGVAEPHKKLVQEVGGYIADKLVFDIEE